MRNRGLSPQVLSLTRKVSMFQNGINSPTLGDGEVWSSPLAVPIPLELFIQYLPQIQFQFTKKRFNLRKKEKRKYFFDLEFHYILITFFFKPLISLRIIV